MWTEGEISVLLPKLFSVLRQKECSVHNFFPPSAAAAAHSHTELYPETGVLPPAKHRGFLTMTLSLSETQTMVRKKTNPLSTWFYSMVAKSLWTTISSFYKQGGGFSLDLHLYLKLYYSQSCPEARLSCTRLICAIMPVSL